MQFENRTLNILKNFSTINPSIVFKEGNSITTMSPVQTIIAKATITETIPKQFAIAELSKFLSVMSLFDTPTLDVKDNHLEIMKDDQSVSYTFGEESLIVYPQKELKLPEFDIEFDLPESTLNSLLKAMAVLKYSEVAISGTGESIYLETVNTKNPSSDTFKVKVGSTTSKFKVIIKDNNLKLISDSYKVKISKKGLAELQGKTVTYWVATEASSVFE
jgi:hypothetical protein